MEIFIISRSRMEELMVSESFSAKDFNIISIVDPDSEFVFAEPTEPNVLQLKFSDLEAEDWQTEKELSYAKEKGYIVFSEAHAIEIISFMNRMDKSKNLIVHCFAGISRSGAIGDFARVKFEIPFGEFILQNRQIQPNSWIRRTLLRLEFPNFYKENNVK